MANRYDSEMGDSGADGFSAAFEMIVTPAIFGLLGWFIDSRVGTFPVFTLVFAGVVLIYEVWRLWSVYNADMDRALKERRTTYHRQPGPSGDSGS